MPKKKRNRSCGVGGQAVLEGVMMKNKDDYAIAVRRSDGEIEMSVDFFKGALHGKLVRKIPFIRGIFNFVDSLVLGMRTINFSASFYDDTEAEPTKFDKALEKVFKEKTESVLMGFAAVLSIFLALGLFILLPYFLSNYLRGVVESASLVLVFEGLLRILIFLGYVVAIGFMKDIRRMYAYHGAEHKCINCIEKGRELTKENAMRSSRLHRRCGTSFMFLVIFISLIIFFFIRVDDIWLRVALRIALIPVIAGISYEIIRWAGRSNNILVLILSAPGMLIQRLTTKEPDADMIEVAIAALEAVFDWRGYLEEKEREDAEAERKAGDVKARKVRKAKKAAYADEVDEEVDEEVEEETDEYAYEDIDEEIEEYAYDEIDEEIEEYEYEDIDEEIEEYAHEEIDEEIDKYEYGDLEDAEEDIKEDVKEDIDDTSEDDEAKEAEAKIDEYPQ